MARTADLRQSTHLRLNEAARQVAILNALPAHIALLDRTGNIISVNAARRNFGDANGLLSAEYGLGINYLQVCDDARDGNMVEAQQAALGVRAVLRGSTDHFALEYPCHSPTARRWFLLTVTPLSSDRLDGVIVIHLDASARKQAQDDIQTLNEGLEEGGASQHPLQLLYWQYRQHLGRVSAGRGRELSLHDRQAAGLRGDTLHRRAHMIRGIRAQSQQLPRPVHPQHAICSHFDSCSRLRDMGCGLNYS